MNNSKELRIEQQSPGGSILIRYKAGGLDWPKGSDRHGSLFRRERHSYTNDTLEDIRGCTLFKTFYASKEYTIVKRALETASLDGFTINGTGGTVKSSQYEFSFRSCNHNSASLSIVVKDAILAAELKIEVEFEGSNVSNYGTPMDYLLWEMFYSEEYALGKYKSQMRKMWDELVV